MGVAISPPPEGRLARVKVSISPSLKEEKEEWMWPSAHPLKNNTNNGGDYLPFPLRSNSENGDGHTSGSLFFS